MQFNSNDSSFLVIISHTISLSFQVEFGRGTESQGNVIIGMIFDKGV